MKKFLMVALLAAGFTAFPYGWAKADHLLEVGEVALLGGYCSSKDAAEELSGSMARGGDAGFLAAMRSPGVHCVHTYMHGNKPVRVKIVSFDWYVAMPNGTRFEFWQFEDGKGQRGWTWMVIEGENGA